MFFIYSLDLVTLKVTIHDSCINRNEISSLLDYNARQFILQEQGEKAAKNPYRDDVADEEITTDGYFLRHEKDSDKIAVYYRKTVIYNGQWWDSHKVCFDKVRVFDVTEYNKDGITNMRFINSNEFMVYDNQEMSDFPRNNAGTMLFSQPSLFSTNIGEFQTVMSQSESKDSLPSLVSVGSTEALASNQELISTTIGSTTSNDPCNSVIEEDVIKALPDVEAGIFSRSATPSAEVNHHF